MSEWVEIDWVEVARTITLEQFKERCAISLEETGLVVLHPAFATALKLYRPELVRWFEGEDS